MNMNVQQPHTTWYENMRMGIKYSHQYFILNENNCNKSHINPIKASWPKEKEN